MENNIRPSLAGTHDIDLSRKRKSTALKQAEVFTDTFPDYNVSRDSKLQRVSSFSGTDLRENTHGQGFNQRNSTAPIFFRHQIEKDQFSYQSDFADTWQTGNGKLHGAGIEKMSNVSLEFPPQPSQFRTHIPFIATPVGEADTYLNRQPQACNLFGQTEAYNSLPSGQSCRDNLEKAKIDPFQTDSLSLEINTGNMRNQFVSTPSEIMRSVEISQQSSQQLDRISDDFGGAACFREANDFRLSCEFMQSGQYSKTAGINGVQTVGTSLRASHCTEHNENNQMLKKEVQYKSSYLGASLGETSDNKEQGNVAGNIKTNEQTKKLDVENSKNNLTEERSLKNGDSSSKSMEDGQICFPSDGSLKLEEKKNLHSVKQAYAAAEILWDGSIQLNSSVTLSAVAYFKSGEKLHDVNWSEFVEVKGKVKLEAFEKYIQDLPRSRNRGLMVISLGWKEGSSESGLVGMKMVAKAYKKWERVGFAQLSQGIDLYICPRCDKIITILAKYGFLKGMAAVVDNQDSFIGCVVWRKNQTSLNTSVKRSESKNAEQPFNSPSDSTKTTDGKMSPIHLAQESSVPIVSVTTSSTTEGAGRFDPESKIVASNEIPPEVNTLSRDNSKLIPTELERFLNSNAASLQFFHDQLSKVEAPPTVSSDPMRPKTSLIMPSEILKHVPTFNDDDLPEFDFGTASGISIEMNKPLGAITFGNRLPTEENRKLDGSVSQTMPNLQSSVSSGSDHSVVPRGPLYTSQGLPMRNVSEHDDTHKTVLEEHLRSSNQVKNMFDDDDDMPEWCPPKADDRTSGGSSGIGATFPSEPPNSTFQMISPSSSRPAFFSQSQIRSHLPFHCPANVNAKMPMPGTSPMEFNSSLSTRPRGSSFDAKLPFPAVDKRGWRP